MPHSVRRPRFPVFASLNGVIRIPTGTLERGANPFQLPVGLFARSARLPTTHLLRHPHLKSPRTPPFPHCCAGNDARHCFLCHRYVAKVGQQRLAIAPRRCRGAPFLFMPRGAESSLRTGNTPAGKRRSLGVERLSHLPYSASRASLGAGIACLLVGSFCRLPCTMRSKVSRIVPVAMGAGVSLPCPSHCGAGKSRTGETGPKKKAGGGYPYPS